MLSKFFFMECCEVNRLVNKMWVIIILCTNRRFNHKVTTESSGLRCIQGELIAKACIFPILFVEVIPIKMAVFRETHFTFAY